MRLIDADALSNALYHEAFETDSDMQKWDSGCWIRYKMFENAIEKAPTIEERKMGKWRDTGSGQECSCCGEIQYGYDNSRRYCPHCGAKMEGADNGTN